MKGNSRDWQTRVRLWAAIIQGTYAYAYFLYYAMGLVSPDAMEGYLNLFVFGGVVTWIVLPVLLTHIGLGLWRKYRRNTFRMPAWELIQIIVGLATPFFLFPHFIDTYSQSFLFGTHENYVDSILLTFPDLFWQFPAMALAVGIHGQIGVHAVLRLRRWYPRVRWVIVVLLSAVTLASIGGYWRAGSTLHHELLAGALAQDDLPHPPTAREHRIVSEIIYGDYAFFAALYLFVFSSRGLRLARAKRGTKITLRYSDGRSVEVFPRTTILEASRIGGIPHAAICGGRGRCTTCRVRVESGAEQLSPVGEREAKSLKRIGATGAVRLACQTECLRSGATVTPLLLPDVQSVKARKETPNSVGRDVRVAVLFADLRGFTELSEGKLPYDVVFILNRYFRYIGEAIEEHGGTIDKFLGDGILAYFGPDIDDREACRNAILASRKIATELEKINHQLAGVLNRSLQIGIGLHFGDVVLGEVGYRSKSSVTIIGDTVNTASRLQSVNKTTRSEMVVSTTVAATAGMDLSYLKVYSVRVRGKSEPIRIYVVPRIIDDLAEL